MKFIKVPASASSAGGSEFLFLNQFDSPLLLVFGYFLAVSLVSFFLFGWDKMKAENNEWRVSEATLLFWAFVGGGAGAVLAQKYFRHKTRKEPFRSLLKTLAIFNIVLYGFVSAAILGYV